MQVIILPADGFVSVALRSGVGCGKPEAKWRNGLSEARGRSDAANARRKRTPPALNSLPSATSVGRGLTPEAFAFRVMISF
jgi:hypothetical protein